MQVIKRVNVPTGDILIVNGSRGLPLECLSIGDYGKAKNIKADFLGHTKPIEGVPHGDLLPLSEKWVITISTQYGCSMGCRFCDVPKVGPGRNASLTDLLGQVKAGIVLHPEITHTDRLNVHFARMGEPTLNPDVISAARHMHQTIRVGRGWGFHPVVSTMMPRKNKKLFGFIDEWLNFKSDVRGDAGLQISVNTTDEAIRERDFGGNAHTLEDIADMLRNVKVVGRKIALNFALTDAPIDAGVLAKLFDSKRFMCKITPMHQTTACVKNGLWDEAGYRAFYPYEKAETELKNAGFDVIVFVPSLEEDASRITCGNAILADGK